MNNHEKLFDRSQFRHDPAYWSATAPDGMVVTAHYLASQAGARMLEQGGNAVDAAVAASLALSVCESAGSGLGGMGMMLIHLAETGRTFTVEGPCRAPAEATPERVANSERYRGYQAIAVPGLVSALDHILVTYGTLNYAQVAAPAIGLAYRGFPLTALQHGLIKRYKKTLVKSEAAGLYLDKQQRPIQANTLIKQPQLGHTLERLAVAGFSDFYKGDIAREMVAEIRGNGGYLSMADLQNAAIPNEKLPIRTMFDNTTAVSTGPPAGGLSLLQLLAAADKIDPGRLNMNDPDAVVFVARLIKRIREERRKYRLKIGAEDLADAAAWLETDKTDAVVDTVIGDIGVPGETSHLCTADAAGNWVSMTQSIERSFGAGVMTPSLGFFYNGYLRAFKVKNKRHPHYLRPGVPARSNAAPTLLLKNNQPCLSIGSTGSERMQSGMFQVLLRLRSESPFDAVHAPRLHCTPEGEVVIEAERFKPAALDALLMNGLSLTTVSAYDFAMGGLQLLCKQDAQYIGVSEPRRDGLAVGYTR